MKIITKQNFFSTVCVVYTMLVLGKLGLEFLTQGVWGSYQGNLLVMFVLSALAVFVLSQYYRFRKYPLVAVIIVQYLVLVGGVMLFTWISGFLRRCMRTDIGICFCHSVFRTPSGWLFITRHYYTR